MVVCFHLVYKETCRHKRLKNSWNITEDLRQNDLSLRWILNNFLVFKTKSLSKSRNCILLSKYKHQNRNKISLHFWNHFFWAKAKTFCHNVHLFVFQKGFISSIYIMEKIFLHNFCSLFIFPNAWRLQIFVSFTKHCETKIEKRNNFVVSMAIEKFCECKL